jgi:hypothetical protein
VISPARSLAASGLSRSIGRSFSFQPLAAISQIDVDQLFTIFDKAQQMRIIVPSSEGPGRPFSFRHELVRQTLLAGISAPRRQRLHASVAEAITAPAISARFSFSSNRSRRRLIINRTFSGTSISSIFDVFAELARRIKHYPFLEQMPVQLLDEEWIALAFLKDEAQKTFRSFALA